MERHARVKELYLACCDLDGDQRALTLVRASAGDDELRAQVEAMLAFDSHHPDFLQRARLAPVLVSGANPRSIGKFRIVARIGEGGMGTVFEAEQDHPHRTVALKLLQAHLCEPRLLRRFEQEGELLGRLEHPGIARIYEAGQVETELGPRPWLSMELVRGVPLTHWARASAVSPRECLALIARVCDAVQHAHEHGVVHRDLKPANILVDDAGQPHVLDFGIARALDTDVRLTTQHLGAGEIVGTLAYMSPEQAAGDSDVIDARSDVYSLGVILHELLADELPYAISGHSLPEAVATIQDQQPRRLGSVRSGLRGDVETIVLTALEKDRRRRYASAAALAEDLRRFLRNEPIAARRPSRAYVLRKYVRRNRTLVSAVLAVFLALVIGLITALRYGLGEAEQRARADLLTTEALESANQASILATQALLDGGSFDAARVQLAATPVDRRGWAWSALEHRLNPLLTERAVPQVWNAAFLDAENAIAVDERGGVFLWDAVTGEWTQVTAATAGARPIALAQDGRKLLSSLDGELILADTRSGEAIQRIRFSVGEPAGGWRGSALASDGSRAAVATTDHALWLVDLASSTVELLAEPGNPVLSLLFSPDARLLAVGAVRQLRLFDCDQRRQRWEKRHSQTTFHGLVFEPTRGVVIAGLDGGIRFFDLDSGESPEDWSPYAIKTQGFGAPVDLALVPGSRLLAALFKYGHLRLMDLDTREVQASFDHRGTKLQVSLAVAPDGEALLTCNRSDGAMRVWNARPRPAEILQGESASIYPLSISPDGALIATGSWDGQARIWEVGSGRLIAALPHKGYGDSVAFAPDGRTLAVGSSRGGLSLWDTRSGASVLWLPDVGTVAIGYSPDGSRLAVGQTARIRILDAATLTGRLEIEIGVGKLSTLAWSGDGRLLASGTNGVDLFLWDAESGAQVAHVQGPRGVDYERWGGLRSAAFSPDGTLLAAGWGGAQVSLYRVSDLTLVRSLTGHAQEVFAVAWSPDGRLLASGGRDNHLRLWNSDTGGLLLDVDAHEDYIFSLAFTPDGRRLVTGSGDGTVRLWDSAPASVRWKERAVARRARERLVPMVTALFAETPEAARVAERIESLPGLGPEDRRAAWNLALERARPVEPAGESQR